ncbi:hypothetical protein AGABI2DRAFT_186698 [Agaricus bisporus var. bisporus H97]|uniref:hypothetical protein n=1 Tax=Agaricus bisporus var. bisporus (strain H97 / ATCC MYA-4626 / FGSC 10389) TaxID=936046 RepID=UPI00029F7F41|nr:hypothetical protein AGABI2DRAFT_186698 [Agaricus bisporus var. bisporus H97]EKV46042.1 hypothetical protein AGABI2DRAFT_186698 [Agaricus bisporus var. bisporus H97]
MSCHKRRPYTIFAPPSLCSSELVCTTLDHDSTDMLLDKWLEHRSPGQDAYHDWFRDLRDRKHAAQNPHKKQIVAWNKGEFVPENMFCKTVDTGRLIPMDRTWTTHVYHHKSLTDRKLSMMPVVFTMLPELMLLRGMHDGGCDDIYIIVTDLKKQEMDDITAYFQLYLMAKYHRCPCLPQIDLTLRGILYEKHPRFVALFSHQTSSYSQIFFTHRDYVPDPDIFYDYPTGCPNPCCTEDCELIRFPRRGVSAAAILPIVNKKGRRRRFRRKEMCNWIECDVCFERLVAADGAEESFSVDGSEGSSIGGAFDEHVEAEIDEGARLSYGQVCGRCKLVRYCSEQHQRLDWPEHKRVCVKASG